VVRPFCGIFYSLMGFPSIFLGGVVMAIPKTGPQRVAVLRSLATPEVDAFLAAVDAVATKRDLDRLDNGALYNSASDAVRGMLIGGMDAFWSLCDAVSVRERELSKAAKVEADAVKASRSAGRRRLRSGTGAWRIGLTGCWRFASARCFVWSKINRWRCGVLRDCLCLVAVVWGIGFVNWLLSWPF
jgi:hypothetical protein